MHISRLEKMGTRYDRQGKGMAPFSLNYSLFFRYLVIFRHKVL